MLDTKFPRILGDVGNALTYDFPVKFKKIKGATSRRVVKEADPSLIKPFIKAAKELEQEGVLAITTSCGFLAIFQEHLANAVKIPFFSSSLLQVPIVHHMLKKNQKVGVLTASKPHLTQLHFKGVGAAHIPMVVYGMEKEEEFPAVFLGQKETLDIAKAENEMVKVASKMVTENPDIGAIVFECTNMPPFRDAVQEVVGLPVFDIITLVNYISDTLAITSETS